MFLGCGLLGYRATLEGVSPGGSPPSRGTDVATGEHPENKPSRGFRTVH